MDKTVVKEHIVLAAAKSFAQKGVKTVRMDDIAAGLSISKRTLYELFHDKEDLLLDVMKLHREEMQEYMTQVASKAENVLEVLLKFFQRSAQDFQNTNRKFFEDIVRAMVCEQMDLLLHSEICKSYSLGEIYETVVFMHMRGISTEKGLKIVDNFLLNLKGNEHNKYG